MAMILNNTVMRSAEMVRTEWQHPNFDFAQLWQAAENGTLDAFHRAQFTKARHAIRQELITDILRCLESLNGVDPKPPQFLRDGRLDKQGLLACLEPYQDLSYYEDRLHFFTRNAAAIDALLNADISWSSRQAWAVFLFLLLHFHFKPKLPIRDQDIRFLLAKLPALPGSRTTSAARQDRLAICGGKFLRCLGNSIFLRENNRWRVWYTDEQELAGLCCTEDLGIIALRADGTLAPCTPEKIRNAAEGRKIVQVSAWGFHYILLCDDGTAVSSLDVSSWKDLSRVQMGPNSVSGIFGDSNRVLQQGSNRVLTDFTDVKTVLTRTCDGQKHFAMLRTDGRLHLDFRPGPIANVEAAALCSRGCVYVQDGDVFLHPVQGGELRFLKELPPDLSVEELHCCDDQILCGTAETPFAISIS